MKKLLLFTLLSCEKPQVKCFICNQNVMINYHDTFRTFRECGLSASDIERFHNKAENKGNSIRTKCYLEK